MIWRRVHFPKVILSELPWSNSRHQLTTQTSSTATLCVSIRSMSTGVSLHQSLLARLYPFWVQDLMADTIRCSRIVHHFVSGCSRCVRSVPNRNNMGWLYTSDREKYNQRAMECARHTHAQAPQAGIARDGYSISHVVVDVENIINGMYWIMAASALENSRASPSEDIILAYTKYTNISSSGNSIRWKCYRR